MFSTLFFLSPGLILSGEYPTLKSSMHFRLDSFSRIGMHKSSVTPGYTVDSYTTMESFCRFLPTTSDADMTNLKSGLLLSLIGVGTDTMMNDADFRSFSSDVNLMLEFSKLPSGSSQVMSIPLLYNSIFSSSMSKPMTSYFLENKTAKGKPT